MKNIKKIIGVMTVMFCFSASFSYACVQLIEPGVYVVDQYGSVEY